VIKQFIKATENKMFNALLETNLSYVVCHVTVKLFQVFFAEFICDACCKLTGSQYSCFRIELPAIRRAASFILVLHCEFSIQVSCF